MLPFEFSLLLLINFLPFSNSIFAYPELLNSLNASLNPCDDFYTFVCDGFHKNVNLRSECTEISNSATRKLLVQSQLEALLSGNIPQQTLSTNQNGQIANLYRKMFGFHQACMEWPGKEMQMGNEVVLGKLEELTEGGGMAFGGPWRRQFDTEWAIKAFPIGAFFQLVALIDTRKGRTNPSRKIVGIRPKSLISSQADWNSNGKSNTQLMSSRFGQIMHVLLEDDIWRALRRNRPPVLFPFTNYILQGEVSPNCLRVNCPMSDQLIRMLFAEAERRVRNLLAVEQKLATNFDTDPLYDHGPLARQSYIKLRQINIHLPSFNFTAFLGALFAPIGLPINGDTEIHVSEPGMLQRLSVVLGQLSGQQIADYLDWQTVWAFLPQMDNRYTRPYVNVNKMKDSLSVRKCPMERRWMQMGEKCEKFLEWYFPHLLDRLYIQRHMGRGVREEVKQIYGNVYAAFRTMLENNSWLDFGTKQRALAKLGSVQANAVYFDQIFNDQYLANLYRQYQAFRLDIPFAQMVHQIEGLNFLRHFSSADYYDPSWGVNAYYSRENNALIVLNGYLHSPIFSPNFSVPLNYAGIGTVLGHELSHGFDDWGSYFNGEGINEDWLGPSMRSVFHEKKQCFVEQYGQIKVNVEGANLPINGTLTVNENIADNGGLAAAYRAWKSLGQTNSAEKLRGLEQFDADQLFFIHYAFRQCSQMGQIWLRQRLMVGQHAVVPARVNIPLQNLPQFATTFKCPVGSPMNPLKKCALW